MLLKQSFHYNDAKDGQGGMPVIRIFEELEDSKSQQKSSARLTESPVNDGPLKNQISQIYGKSTHKANKIAK